MSELGVILGVGVGRSGDGVGVDVVMASIGPGVVVAGFSGGSRLLGVGSFVGSWAWVPEIEVDCPGVDLMSVGMVTLGVALCDIEILEHVAICKEKLTVFLCLPA